MKYTIILFFFLALACTNIAPNQNIIVEENIPPPQTDSIIPLNQNPMKNKPQIKGESIGTLNEVQWGDYGHLVIQTENSYESFWIRNNMEEEEIWQLENPENKGRRLKVLYTDTMYHPPQSDNPMPAKFLDEAIFIDK